MNKQRFVTIIGLLFIAFTVQAQPAGWSTISGKTYNISFPEMPEHNLLHDSTDFGLTNINLYMVNKSTSENPDVIMYVFVETAFPNSEISSDNQEILATVYDSNISGIVTGMDGELVSSKEIKIGNYMGRSARITMSDGYVIINIQMVLVDSVLLMAQVITVADKEFTADAQAFINSLKIL